jgi:hypothetical protein
MANFTTNRSSSRSYVISSLVALSIIGVSALVVSGKFSSIVTPFGSLAQSFASATKPKITQTFVDAFKATTIDTEAWIIRKTGDATIAQTAANNLRMNVPAGAESGRVKSANLTFKETFDDRGDFRVNAIVYRPIVTGEGAGVAGVRFVSAGSENDEGAVIQWVVNGTQSRVSFVVRGENGARLESQAEELKSNVAVFRLERINKKYRAYYKMGNDMTGDTAWKQLGEEQRGNLGNEGRVVLFTHNAGSGGKFPQVVGRFDGANIGWEGESSDRIGFADAFANGVLAKEWTTAATAGSTAQERASDNLVLTVPAGAVNGKMGRMVVVRKQPIVRSGKDFAVQAKVYKPTLTGEGTGATGVSFVSNGSTDDEAAQIRWIVSSGGSRIVFLVRNTDGTLAERAGASIDANVKSLTLRLTRTGDRYVGAYRTGDNDANFVRVGIEEQAAFGADGKVALFVTNAGVSDKYPRVVARFDQVNGSMAK